jgi:hypothetical protein
MTPRQMPIPVARGHSVWLCTLTLIVLVFSMIAAWNVLHGEAYIPSGLWLVVVIYGVRQSSVNEGGFRSFAVKCLGDFSLSHFSEIASSGENPATLMFGFQILGHRFIQQRIDLNKVESVEWSSGQATGLAGRDMQDWSVALWFDQVSPIKKWKGLRKPDQDVLIVGPARRKEDTEAFGLTFVHFLQEAGVDLIRGENGACFARRDKGPSTYSSGSTSA